MEVNIKIRIVSRTMYFEDIDLSFPVGMKHYGEMLNDFAKSIDKNVSMPNSRIRLYRDNDFHRMVKAGRGFSRMEK